MILQVCHSSSALKAQVMCLWISVMEKCKLRLHGFSTAKIDPLLHELMITSCLLDPT